MNKATLLAFAMALASLGQAQTWTKVHEDPFYTYPTVEVEKVSLGPGQTIPQLSYVTVTLVQSVSGDHYTSMTSWPSWLDPRSYAELYPQQLYPKETARYGNVTLQPGESYKFWVAQTTETGSQRWWNPTVGTAERSRYWMKVVYTRELGP